MRSIIGIILCFLLTAIASTARAQPYVAVGLVSLEPELAVGYAFKRMSFEAATYGEHELERIQTLTSAETWTAKGARLTARLEIPVTEWAELTAGASAHYAKYEHSAPAGSSSVREWTPGLLLGARFRMAKISDHASLRLEWMLVDSPSGYERMDGTRMSFDWSF